MGLLPGDVENINRAVQAIVQRGKQENDIDAIDAKVKDFVGMYYHIMNAANRGKPAVLETYHTIYSEDGYSCVLNYMSSNEAKVAGFEMFHDMFDAANGGRLASFFKEDSMLTLGGEKIQGSQNIVAKLTSVLFQHCELSSGTVDWQQSCVSDGMLVFVTGNLKRPGAVRDKFNQIFHLIPSAERGFYVLNNILRLYHA